MAVYWRDMLNRLEAECADLEHDDVAAMLRHKLLALDQFRDDYEKQGERAEREVTKIEYEALKIRKELGANEREE